MAIPNIRAANAMTEEEKAYLTCKDREQLSQLDNSGRTHLHLAAQAGKAAVCRIYMNAGLDPASTDNAGRSAADLACAAGYLSLSRTLEASIAARVQEAKPIEHSEYTHELDVHEQRGLISGELHMVEKIIKLGRISARNAKGDTALHLAAAGGHIGICNRLFEAGADAAIKNNAWQTPADMAAQASHSQLAVLLRELTVESSTAVQAAEVAPPSVFHEAASDPFGNGDAFEDIEFVEEEHATLFHSRHGSKNVSATFRAFSAGADIKSGGSEDTDEWTLPEGLARVRDANLIHDQVSTKAGGASDPRLDFSYSTGRSVKKARKLRNTTFKIDADACQHWTADVIAHGSADEMAISDLVSLCEGDYIPEDLAANVRKVLQSAGLAMADDVPPFEMLVRDTPEPLDVEQLSEALLATCTRETIVPGRKPFAVGRALEDRLIREIGNARHQLLNGLLEDSYVISAILSDGALVVAGEVPADTFTDLELGGPDDEEELAEFAEQLEALQSAVFIRSEISGRARRGAIEALDLLEISRTYLLDLASRRADVTVPIRDLLSNWDRSTEQLLLAHLPFARRETAKMAALNEDPEELFQEAYFAMRRAVERFDPERGIRFYMYAHFWLRQHLTRWRMNNRSLIRVPVHRYELHEKAASFADEFRDQNMRDPSDLELAEAMDCDTKTIRSLAVALSPPLEFSAIFADVSDASESPEIIALTKNCAGVIAQALDNLGEREEAVLRLRFGIGRDDDMTLEEVGQIYGVTRERIRQIEAGALKKLKHPANSRTLRALL